MTKKELVAAVAKEAGVSQVEAGKVIAATFEAIAAGMKKGDVRVDGFGTFRVSKRAARSGVNPATKAVIKIPAKKVPAFRPATALKERVK